jgi:hypothetical protein
MPRHANGRAEREIELPSIVYFHAVYTLPAELRDVAYHNKRDLRSAHQGCGRHLSSRIHSALSFACCPRASTAS